MNWSQRVQFAKIRVCAKIWQVTNDNGGESCFFFTRPQSPWDMFHMCWIPSAHTSVTWPPCLKAALHARSQYGAHSWWGEALLSSFILILQKLMPYGSVFSPTTERKAVLQLKILIIWSKYSRTNETGKGTGKLKKTTRINEKWPPLDITLQSDSYRKFPQEKALPNVSLQQQQPVPLGSPGSGVAGAGATVRNYLNEVFWTDNTLELVLQHVIHVAKNFLLLCLHLLLLFLQRHNQPHPSFGRTNKNAKQDREQG